MTMPRSYIRNCTTSELNRLLEDADRPIEDAIGGIHLTPEALQDVRAEKDRRLSDPNSPDFRPIFF